MLSLSCDSKFSVLSFSPELSACRALALLVFFRSGAELEAAAAHWAMGLRVDGGEN